MTPLGTIGHRFNFIVFEKVQFYIVSVIVRIAEFIILQWVELQIILPVVLYGCETWCLTLREESRLRAFENRFLRRIFGPKRDEDGGVEKAPQ